MKDKFYKRDDGTALWSDDKVYYYGYPNIRLVRSDNLLKDEDNDKIYEIVNDEFIYLRKDGFRYVEGKPYVWYK